MSLKEVKNKIRSIKKIHQVTKAMEAVSAAKMRRSQFAAIEARPFALAAIGVLRRLVHRGVAQTHPLVQDRNVIGRVLVVVVTSDRGLAGALNGGVLRVVYSHLRKKGLTNETVDILAIGKKGYEHFSRKGFTVIDHVERWGEGVTTEDPDTLARRLIAEYRAHTYDRVYVAYSNFISTFNQEPVVRRMLPISFGALEEVIEGIVPSRGKYSEYTHIALREGDCEYVFEPSPSVVLDELLPYLLGVVLHHAVLEANASEHSARMVAMKSASDRARDIAKELTLAFNKERQSAITAEVSEITSGIEAMR